MLTRKGSAEPLPAGEVQVQAIDSVSFWSIDGTTLGGRKTDPVKYPSRGGPGQSIRLEPGQLPFSDPVLREFEISHESSNAHYVPVRFPAALARSVLVSPSRILLSDLDDDCTARPPVLRTNVFV